MRAVSLGIGSRIGRTRLARATAVLLLALFGPARGALGQGGLVHAQAPVTSEPEKRSRAKEHFRKGKAFQDAGAYDQAIAEYQAAFDLMPLPELIFNLGQCHRLKGDKRAAVAAYNRYLEAAPAGRGAPDARGFVAELSRQIAEEDARAASAPAAATPTATTAPAPTPAPAPAPGSPPAAAGGDTPSPPTAIAGATASGTDVGANVRATLPSDAGPQASAAAPGRRLRIAGLVSAGVGVALIAGGVAFGLKARSAKNDLGGLEVWDADFYASRKSDGEAAERNMFILVGAGAAAVIGGGVAYLLGARAAGEGSRSPAVGAALTAAFAWTPGGLTLGATGRF
jgi:hypothetical protein